MTKGFDAVQNSERPLHTPQALMCTLDETYSRSCVRTNFANAADVAHLVDKGLLPAAVIQYGDVSQPQAQQVKDQCVESASHAAQHHVRIPEPQELCQMPSADAYGASNQDAQRYILRIKR